ncbi:MAG: hypothetical protein GX931_03860 [Acholeplasmataceae bacterium]|nr:hypothetical protein [Acholeplasmataceae bacterium]
MNNTLKKEKYFKKFTIKEIVYLSIISIISILGSSVMMLVVPLVTQIYGIAQLVTSFQVSILFSIGLFKVRKPGSILYMALFMGAVMVFMSFIMFVVFLTAGLLVEGLGLLIFRKSESNLSVIVKTTLFMPLTLPLNFLLNLILAEEVQIKLISKVPWITVVVTLAVILISLLGSFLGVLMSKEIKKAKESKDEE